ncbi:hypothetical protein PR08_gp12 [Idiomarinaceae phage Phi1M2-2]|uniref:hypothetical protein n=1 Tax=Idiomarinaceae phage Phi1M2-2 TaxID=1527515 RepID=UPI0004F90B03|nr:hypothetical protein PR08_gp12 [Idiomarinaceae phage Phi1M2-2]AIM40823.1 hypothetical protein M22_012 [Idiomarinaceae phage Phi1M2-2]
MSIQYAFVKLVNDQYGVAQKCKQQIETKKRAQQEALESAKSEIGCDTLLYGRGNSLYIGYKSRPKAPDAERWWRKNDVDYHDGYYTVSPKVKTEQHEKLSKIRASYRKALGEGKDTSEVVRSAYPDLVGGVCGSYGRSMCIADPAFGLVGDIIIGKLPIPSEGRVVIPDDFEELTATQFNEIVRA